MVEKAALNVVRLPLHARLGLESCQVDHQQAFFPHGFRSCKQLGIGELDEFFKPSLRSCDKVSIFLIGFDWLVFDQAFRVVLVRQPNHPEQERLRVW